VALANAIARAWPDRRLLEYVHAPLDGLQLAPGTRFFARFAHEDQPLDEQRFVLALIERSVGGPVAVSHASALGRRSPEVAECALRRAAELAA
jgi:hypothetical protein